MGLLKQAWACLHTNPAQRAVGVRQRQACCEVPGRELPDTDAHVGQCSSAIHDTAMGRERHGPALASLFCYSHDHRVNWTTGLLEAKTNPFPSGLVLSLSHSLWQWMNACCLTREKAMDEEGTISLVAVLA